MKDIFITKLILEKVRNLDYIEIPLSDENRKHLIFTGKNGSGKTTILDGLSSYLYNLSTSDGIEAKDKRLLSAIKQLDTLKMNSQTEEEILKQEKEVKSARQIVEKEKKGFIVQLNYPNHEIRSSFEAGEFIIAYFRADRIFAAGFCKIPPGSENDPGIITDQWKAGKGERHPEMV